MEKILFINHRTNQMPTDKNSWLWRSIQATMLLVGSAIFLALIFFPEYGIHAFWNILIPVAPALFVFGTGVWRNICPLASVSLLPRHTGISKSKRLSLKWQARLQLTGVILLFVVIPVRHIVLDTSGPATALALVLLTTTAFTMGYIFEWKSGWCSSLCPVHPVEKLYGEKTLFTPPNAHCGQCANCVVPCPDSIPKKKTGQSDEAQNKKHCLHHTGRGATRIYLGLVSCTRLPFRHRLG